MTTLPRLQIATPLVNDNGMLSTAAHRHFETLTKSIESQLGALQVAQAAQAAAIAANTAAIAAQGTANTAVTNAAAAQTTANTGVTNAATAQGTATATSALQNTLLSYVAGITINSATTSAGASTITISAHTRIYGNGTSVAVNSGVVLGLTASTPYWIYYDDPTLAGGAVTYQVTTNYTAAYANGAMPTRLVVGAITSPAAGGTSAGTGSTPGGFVHP